MVLLALSTVFIGVAFAAPNGLKLRSLTPLPSSGRPKFTIGNNAVSWFADVQVGNQTFNLIVDTGSANTWIGSNKTFIPVPGNINTHQSFSLQYGGSYANGTQWIADVTVAGLKATNQSIGVASYWESFGVDGSDGILGLGCIGQTTDVVSNTPSVPTFLNNLKTQGLIEDEVLGVYLAPMPRGETYARNGEMTIGWIDHSRYDGEITWTGPAPKSDTGMLSSWVVPVEGVVSDGVQLQSYSGGSALFDTGVTHLFAPPDVFTEWLEKAGGTYNNTYYLSAFEKRPTATFGLKINGTNFELTPEQYLIPEHLYHVWDLPHDNIWSHISTAGPGNFFVGDAFLESFYTVYDTDNARIGFAPALHFHGNAA
ncbi:acid protease [Auriculariales sp. MPI-PUGE-AT-0066]|nr:acid protease [Auriculariales sp. MPI-PUGE-AT-0066]